MLELLKQKLDQNPLLKKWVHRMLIPSGQARPRWWVKIFLGPLFVKKGRGSLIRRNIRFDVVPFNSFAIGDFSTIEDYSVINNGVGEVRIGDRSRIGISNVVIGPVIIGNDVIMAQHVVLSGLNHGYQDVSLPPHEQTCTTAPIIIEDEVWIGANAVITSGTKIGKHAVVGAVSIVTRDVPPYSVVVGNPAKIVKQYDFEQGDWVRPVREVFIKSAAEVNEAE